MRSILHAGFAYALVLFAVNRTLAQCELSGEPFLTDTTRSVFGTQIAVGSEWLVVQGSRSDPTPFYGSLNIYRRLGDVWVFDAAIELGAFNNEGIFGDTVDVFGNRIIVGVRFGPGGPTGVRILSPRSRRMGPRARIE